MSFLLALIPPQYKLLAEVIIIAAIFGAGFTSGFKIESWRWGAVETEQVEEAHKEFKAEADKGAEASGDLAKKEEAVRVQVKTVTRVVDRIVDRPVYRNVCLDDDGLRAVNAALTGASLDPGQPDGTLPGPGAAGKQGGGTGAAKAGGGRGSVPPVPGAPR